MIYDFSGATFPWIAFGMVIAFYLRSKSKTETTKMKK